jgi:uncharacterized protein (TIGR02117 family)
MRGPRLLLLALVLSVVAACAGRPIATAGRVPAAAKPAGPDQLTTALPDAGTVYVVSNGWHTGVVLARDQVSAALWPEQPDFVSARFVEVGWGDRTAYLAHRLTARLALGAALGSSSTALHVTGFDAPPAERYRDGELAEVRLTPGGLENLARFIHGSYARDPHGNAIPLGPGASDGGAFYLATGRYHLFNTCNTWTARALRAAGCPMTPPLALTASQLMHQALTTCRGVRVGSI